MKVQCLVVFLVLLTNPQWFCAGSVFPDKQFSSIPRISKQPLNEIYNDDTADETEEIKHAFAKTDIDRSDGLSLSEMTEAMSVIENADVNVIKLFEEYFPTFDVDNDKELNLRETIDAHFKFGGIISSLMENETANTGTQEDNSESF